MLALSSLRRWCGIVPSVRAALLACRALHGDQLVGDLQHVLVAGALDQVLAVDHQRRRAADLAARSDEHTSELQSLMRISYAVFCLTKKITYLTPYISPTSTTTHQ